MNEEWKECDQKKYPGWSISSESRFKLDGELQEIEPEGKFNLVSLGTTKVGLKWVMAYSFLEEIPSKKSGLVNIDGDISNCHPSNLKWSSFAYNNSSKEIKSLENETWLELVGFEEIYQISDMGRVKKNSYTTKDASGEVKQQKAILLSGGAERIYTLINSKTGERRKAHGFELVEDAFSNEFTESDGWRKAELGEGFYSYELNEAGDVRAMATKELIHKRITQYGYVRVKFKKLNLTTADLFLGEVVYSTFSGSSSEVDFIDGNRLDCSFSNLVPKGRPKDYVQPQSKESYASNRLLEAVFNSEFTSKKQLETALKNELAIIRGMK